MLHADWPMLGVRMTTLESLEVGYETKSCSLQRTEARRRHNDLCLCASSLCSPLRSLLPIPVEMAPKKTAVAKAAPKTKKPAVPKVKKVSNYRISTICTVSMLLWQALSAAYVS